ncbi:MAG: hypothetical protein GTO02_20535 [Candidatus Dadabacteria bacterium]|nr:hypothetical protein [Candidatus Dadabacteria bacterium]NIQ16680.1 hypothetical protein [Candidatus Dadabacteria bacterium]
MSKKSIYIVSILIFFAGLVLFYFNVKSNLSGLEGTLREYVFPGEYTVELDQDDTYSIYHQFVGSIDGVKINNESLDLNAINVEVFNKVNDSKVELVKPESIKRYRYMGRKGIKFLEFNNTGINKYLINSSLKNGSDDIKYILTIEQGFEQKRIKGIIGSQAVLIIPTIFALLLFIRTYIRK